MNKKYVLFLLGILIAVYSLKTYLSVDVLKSFSLNDYIPLKFLQNRAHILSVPDSGFIILEKFKDPEKSTKRFKLWMNEQGKVFRSYISADSCENNYLLIENTGKSFWSYELKKFIPVEPGDFFSYEVDAKIDGAKLSTSVCIITYDRDEKVISWHFAQDSLETINIPKKLNKRFTIPVGVYFIRFQITGIGVGKFEYKEIIFRKELGSN